jgi:hypothetical protein
MDGEALKGLTVAFHEPGFVGTLNSESVQPFWFQLSSDAKQKAGDPWGPQNAQALNRYSYVRNAPVRWSDPSGHDRVETQHCNDGICHSYGYQEVRTKEGKIVRDSQGRIIWEVWSCELGAGARCTVMWVPDGPEFQDYKHAVDALVDLNEEPIAKDIGWSMLAAAGACIKSNSWACAGAVIIGVAYSRSQLYDFYERGIKAAAKVSTAFAVIGYGNKDTKPSAIYRCKMSPKCKSGDY